jgi:hypothetical protein
MRLKWTSSRQSYRQESMSVRLSLAFDWIRRPSPMFVVVQRAKLRSSKTVIDDTLLMLFNS